MHPIDLTVVVVYVLACTLLGAWLGRGQKGAKGYFLGEGSAPTWAIMLSIVATETSTVTFLSLPGKSYAQGGDFSFLQLGIGYIVGRVLVARFLLPGYFRGEIMSAYQVLGTRFGGTTKSTASVLFLAMRTVGDGLRLVLTAKALQAMSGLGTSESILIMGAATILYTYLGGMTAVIWTDVVQFFVYVAGALVALWLLTVGGTGGVWAQPEKFRTFEFAFAWSDPYTIWAGVFGGALLSMATHGADQLMVQRYLAARSQRQAAIALVSSGVVVFVQFMLFLFIGVALSAHYAGLGGPLPKPDQAFSGFLASGATPVGLRGLIVAGLFAAAMSTLSSSLNASAASSVSDLLVPLRPNLGERAKMRWSRGLTAFWGLAQVGIAFATIGVETQAIDNVLTIASLVAGLLLGLFVLGLANRRAGEPAALAGLLVGALVVLGSWWFLGKALAFPWYAPLGAGTVLAVGSIVAGFVPRKETK